LPAVPNNAKGAAQAAGEPMPFEEALKKLEKMVDEMESGELPLEAMLARFEEGTRLVKVCQTKLEEAELKVQKLEKNAAGEVTLKPVQTAEG
jgi:exodeoxyribonuclease VII small subunit